MSIRRVVPTIATDDPAKSREFYMGLLGFEVAMDLGWIVTLASPINSTAQISLAPTEAAGKGIEGVVAMANRVGLTVEVADVDAVHARVVARGHPVVYPLTTEQWGVRRFAVTDPSGVVVNVMSHVG